ncbi:MAG: hypothetical protein RXR18_05255 [Nitrososphaeria archaeon]
MPSNPGEKKKQTLLNIKSQYALQLLLTPYPGRSRYKLLIRIYT